MAMAHQVVWERASCACVAEPGGRAVPVLGGFLERLKVPGGWLVRLGTAGRVPDRAYEPPATFVPDPDHAWRLDAVESGAPAAAPAPARPAKPATEFEF